MKRLDLANPYAKAAFEYALEHKQLKEWDAALDMLAQLMHNHDVREYIAHPMVSDSDGAEVLWTLLTQVQKKCPKEVFNFIKTASYYEKLIVLPEIFAVYQEYAAEENQLVRAVATSAAKLTAAQEKQIISALNAKYSREVSLECLQDKNLIGGVKVQVGDWVLDNTIKNRLTRLNHSLGEN